MPSQVSIVQEDRTNFGRILRAPGIVEERRGDELRLVNQTGESHDVTSPFARRVWALLCDGPTLSVLVDQLREYYRKPTELIVRQAGAVVVAWRAVGLVHITT